jgi:hypothetical protein
MKDVNGIFFWNGFSIGVSVASILFSLEMLFLR